jgi:hypothetical protein
MTHPDDQHYLDAGKPPPEVTYTTSSTTDLGGPRRSLVRAWCRIDITATLISRVAGMRGSRYDCRPAVGVCDRERDARRREIHRVDALETRKESL